VPRSVETGRDFIFADVDSGEGDGGSTPTYHFLPNDPDLAYNILKNEIGGSGTRTAVWWAAGDDDGASAADALYNHPNDVEVVPHGPGFWNHVKDWVNPQVSITPTEQDPNAGPPQHTTWSRRQALQDTQVLKKEVMGPEGGFTIKDHIGDGPKSGYMVSLNKSTERAYPENDFTADDIAQYQQSHASELSDPDCYFGAWHDPETHKVYLDVSKCFQDYNDAMKAAKAADQLAIFDLGSFDTIYTSRKVRRQYFPANSDPNAVFNKIWGE
jgi:hypothetical protein